MSASSENAAPMIDMFLKLRFITPFWKQIAVQEIYAYERLITNR